MKPVLVSGVQPTGKLHIGNYLGALKNFVDLQNSGKYQCYFFIADLHSLTENFNPKEKQKQILNLTADFLAAGLDPKKSVIFQQSQIPAHSELMWVLNTITPMGELKRMTQFKDKAEIVFDPSKKDHREEIWAHLDAKHNKGEKIWSDQISAEEANALVTNIGLFDYPVLMAADIIIYDAKFVPVGNDQDQHLEITRTLARKFNTKFGKTFIEPQALHTETPRVMSLANPEKKMSKSQPESCLFIDDSPEEIKNKIKRAVTDSGSEIKHKKDKPAISNLLEIYSALSGEKVEKLGKKFAGKNYSTLKNDLAELTADYFADFRKKKTALLKNPAKLSTVLAAGSKKAEKIANKKILEVKKKVGLI
ncbi:MAG: tryptophan--tRNA ligase [Spirochaetia bacterium]|nr:MAG: tryptophan--tRNA ligase [Spirochaetia bacterium]